MLLAQPLILHQLYSIDKSACFFSVLTQPVHGRLASPIFLCGCPTADTGVFLQPVDPRIAPDYYDLIKKPMDLSQIGRNIESGVYKSIWSYMVSGRLCLSLVPCPLICYLLMVLSDHGCDNCNVLLHLLWRHVISHSDTLYYIHQRTNLSPGRHALDAG